MTLYRFHERIFSLMVLLKSYVYDERVGSKFGYEFFPGGALMYSINLDEKTFRWDYGPRYVEKFGTPIFEVPPALKNMIPLNSNFELNKKLLLENLKSYGFDNETISIVNEELC